VVVQALKLSADDPMALPNVTRSGHRARGGEANAFSNLCATEDPRPRSLGLAHEMALTRDDVSCAKCETRPDRRVPTARDRW
jgi:hypothetical protein